MAVIPSFLKPGDGVIILATARKVAQGDIAGAINWIEENGWKPILGEHLFSSHFQFAGTDIERLSDLQNALGNPEVKAILCARGGYGSLRLLDALVFPEQPLPWLIGFSDITAIQAWLLTHGVASIHGPMAVNAGGLSPMPVDKESWDRVAQILKGNAQEVTFTTDPELSFSISGTLAGGNLSVWHALAAGPEWNGLDPDILFLEDIDEHLYHIDRMVYMMQRAGKFKEGKVLLAGQFTGMRNLNPENPFGADAMMILKNAANRKGMHFVPGYPGGHASANHPFVVGGRYQLVVKSGVANLLWMGS